MPDRFGDPADAWPRVPAPQTAPDDVWAAERRAMQIVECEWCDESGMRGLHRCDHVDHASAAVRGMALIREALGKTKEGK